jgi:hypothetical protein
MNCPIDRLSGQKLHLGLGLTDAVRILTQKIAPVTGFFAATFRKAALEKMAYCHGEAVGGVEVAGLLVKLEEALQHGGDLLLAGGPVAGHGKLDLAGGILIDSQVVDQARSHRYPLGAAQFEHRLGIFAVKGSLQGHLGDLILLDQAAHALEDALEFVGVALLCPLHLDDARGEQAHFFAFSLNDAVARHLGAGVYTEDDAHAAKVRNISGSDVMPAAGGALVLRRGAATFGGMRAWLSQWHLPLPLGGEIASRWVRGGQVVLTLAVLAYAGSWVYREAGSLDARSFVPQGAGWGWAGLALLLMPLNLALETAKWRVPLRRAWVGGSFVRAWQAVFAGVTTGLFTPNRVGEYGGRLLFVPAAQRWAAAAYTWTGRLAQMLATLLTGALGLAWVGQGPGLQVPAGLGLGPQGLAGLGLLLALLAGAALWWGLPRLWLSRRWQRLRTAWAQLSPPVLVAMTGWALGRYLVFATQYVLLLQALGACDSWSLAFGLVSLVFWVKSLIPALTLSELGIRESVALAVMVPYGLPAAPVLAATLLLFAVNLLLPAALGLLFIYRLPPPEAYPPRS